MPLRPSAQGKLRAPQRTMPRCGSRGDEKTVMLRGEPSRRPIGSRFRLRLILSFHPLGCGTRHRSGLSCGADRCEANMTSRKILLVDDDADLSEALIDQLSLYDEFELTHAKTATSGLQAARDSHTDLVIMDVGLPDMDGREAVKLLRKSGLRAPIIMLTGHDTDSDTILGLEAGANDYVVKPFRFAVLLARIRAHLRQHEQSEDATFSIGRYTFRPAAKMLLDDGGGKIRLTEKETAILKYLYRAGDRIVTRDVLLSEVWGYNSGVTTHTLETHIYRLRQKIERDPSHAELLVTESGGYKLAR
jgi:DNA-binding response OmpR family regulator